MRRRLSFLLAILALVFPSATLADSVTVPPDAGLPWTDPAHRGPLEVLASQIASRIAGRSVSVRCWGENDWNALAQSRGFDPTKRLGYVSLTGYVYRDVMIKGAPFAELSPKTCWYLQEFAKAALKPTKCQPLETVEETVYESEYRLVKVRVQVTRRVRAKGKWVTKKVWVTKPVWKQVTVPKTVTREVPGEPTPCYLGSNQFAEDMPRSYWQEYRNYAHAIQTLAHEAIHLAQYRAGVRVSSVQPTAEIKAECYGTQWAPWVAEQLGATPDDARAIATYYYEVIYPNMQSVYTNDGRPYWSPDCRQDGPLDLTPGDGVWP
jgi:hypothetical protein